MSSPSLNKISATEAARLIRHQEVRSVDLVEACLERIQERERIINAWVEFEPEIAFKEAQKADERLKNGDFSGPLHGVPVGLKDIIDTFDMPTQIGSAVFSNRRPMQDARCVSFLREAGAIILGKTVTTEFALTGAKKTANPHNTLHTPGGSSSGSAAAVADFMVPLAVGSQTGGSMIRPASYCGIYGYKPTFGSISRRGVFILARVLDHLGVYARSLEDLALISDCIMGYDPGDFDMMRQSGYKLRAMCDFDTNQTPPRIAFVKGPAWKYTEHYISPLFESYLTKLGNLVEEVNLSGIFEKALDAHKVIMESNLWHNLSSYRLKSENLLMPETVKRIDKGKNILASQYIEAIELVGSLEMALKKLFAHHDVIITPSATGEPPKGLNFTGDAAMQRIWTLTGLPTISMPHISGPSGLPIGVQVIGKKGCDGELFKIAKWLDGIVREHDD